MKRVDEAAIERHLVNVTKAYSGIAIKLMFLRGWPDRIVFLPGGRVFFVELKRPVGGKFEPLQERRHAMLRKMGFIVLVARTKGEINDFFTHVLKVKQDV